MYDSTKTLSSNTVYLIKLYKILMLQQFKKYNAGVLVPTYV